jgi:hypothetical protein
VRASQLALVLALPFLGCTRADLSEKVDRTDDRAALLAAHQRILDAHLNDDLEDWLALEADTVVVGNRGELQVVEKAATAPRRRAYLADTEFEIYRDLQPPIVRVAADGSVGWVVAQVEVVGTRALPSGAAPIDDVWAWVELYEKKPEGWRLVGNVSTVRPPPG